MTRRIPRIKIPSRPLIGPSVPLGRIAITSVPPSLNNAFFNLKSGGRSKSAAYKAWQQSALKEMRAIPAWHVPGEIEVAIGFSRKQTGADVDNLIKPILDLLVASGRMSDDRRVYKVTALFNDALGTRIAILSAHADNGEFEARDYDLLAAERRETA